MIHLSVFGAVCGVLVSACAGAALTLAILLRRVRRQVATLKDGLARLRDMRDALDKAFPGDTHTDD